jgi:CheY-like chemotaxis protein
MLEDHGYGVVEASDGTSALELLATNHASIDLTLTDVVMRRMSGPEMVLNLAQSRPRMKVVYMSGYTGQLLSERDTVAAGLPLLEKPFTRASLLQTLDAALR